MTTEVGVILDKFEYTDKKVFHGIEKRTYSFFLLYLYKSFDRNTVYAGFYVNFKRPLKLFLIAKEISSLRPRITSDRTSDQDNSMTSSFVDGNIIYLQHY